MVEPSRRICWWVQWLPLRGDFSWQSTAPRSPDVTRSFDMFSKSGDSGEDIVKWQCVKTLVPLVNIKIAGKWMFIPLKMVLIGIDPYPNNVFFNIKTPCDLSRVGIWSRASASKSTGLCATTTLEFNRITSSSVADISISCYILNVLNRSSSDLAKSYMSSSLVPLPLNGEWYLGYDLWESMLPFSLSFRVIVGT